jgi:hypothetical protein
MSVINNVEIVFFNAQERCFMTRDRRLIDPDGLITTGALPVVRIIKDEEEESRGDSLWEESARNLANRHAADYISVSHPETRKKFPLDPKSNYPYELMGIATMYAEKRRD